MGRHVSASLILSTGAPQGCVPSPLLYSLYTYDCVATTNIKFADDTVMVGLISDNNEMAYLEEIRNLENWCQRNNLLLNVSKTLGEVPDSPDQQEPSGESGQLQIPRGSHHTGPVMALSHQHHGEKGLAASLPPQTLERF
ncbi:hypothetical protein QTP86_003604 [Hemibagrus guttatus]|nr:hypothetical protein QTP86_003604 [Hemibagrus guttatus]